MSPLHSCPHCASLNPQGQSICLNCDAELTVASPKRSRLVKNILKGAGLVAISMTLSACYGGGEDMYSCQDDDRDGVCRLDDCDDNDPNADYSCDEQGPAGETMSDPN